MASQSGRIFLSPPHMSGAELKMIEEAFAANWIAPVGPHISAFEEELAATVGSHHAVAVTSGTAALHLALIGAGVKPGDDVVVSSFTFVASVNPIAYLGARPVFVDCERATWNMDPALLAEKLHERGRKGNLPAAVIVVHMLGQSADLDPIAAACAQYDVPLIEDAAEALGATYKGRSPGTVGRIGVFSFNGNKIITTSGGGMLVTDDAEVADRARKLATQARDPAPHYEHSEVGYNYRLSNLLAGVGRAQLAVLEDRVEARRAVFARYRAGLGDLPGIDFQPEAPWGRHTRWMSAITVDPQAFGADRETIRLALERENIESRPVWKPMHRQPLYAGHETIGGDVADDLFAHGLCLPSGSSLTTEQIDRVIAVIRGCHR